MRRYLAMHMPLASRQNTRAADMYQIASCILRLTEPAERA